MKKSILFVLFLLVCNHSNAFISIMCETWPKGQKVCYIFKDVKCGENGGGWDSCTEIYFKSPRIYKDKFGKAVVFDQGKLYNIAPDRLIALMNEPNGFKEIEAYSTNPDNDKSVSESRIQAIAKEIGAQVIVLNNANINALSDGTVIVDCTCCKQTMRLEEKDIESHAKSCCKTSLVKEEVISTSVKHTKDDAMPADKPKETKIVKKAAVKSGAVPKTE